MAMDYTDIDEVVNDFQLMIDDTSYDNEAQIYQLRLLALQGLRELTFDVEQSIKNNVRTVTSSLATLLPNDYVKLLRVGYKNDDGNFVSLGYSSDLSLDANVTSKVGSSSYDENNPYYHTDIGKKFGVGGGKNSLGYYRINRNDNSINFSSELAGKTVFMEYISDGVSETSLNFAADHRLKLIFNDGSDTMGGENVSSSTLYIPDPTVPLSTSPNLSQEYSFRAVSPNEVTSNLEIAINLGDTANAVAKKFASVINDGHPSLNIDPYSTILTASRHENEVILSYKSMRPGLLTNVVYSLNYTADPGKPLEKAIEVLQVGGDSRKPRVHKFCEEALRCYIYYKYVQRRRGIPANEKQMAKRAYYNEKRLARARMMNFNKEAAMQVSRKAFKQSPKI